MFRQEEEECRAPGPKSLQFRHYTWPTKAVLLLQLDDAQSWHRAADPATAGQLLCYSTQHQAHFTAQAKQHNRSHGNDFFQHSCVGQTHLPLTLLHTTLGSSVMVRSRLKHCQGHSQGRDSKWQKSWTLTLIMLSVFLNERKAKTRTDIYIKLLFSVHYVLTIGW